jgi:hypothetical protein
MWQCAGSGSIVNQTQVFAQVCAVRSSGRGQVQGAVIVHNEGSSPFVTTADVDVTDSINRRLGEWTCSSSGIAAHSWSVCFTPTLTEELKVDSAGTVGDTPLGISPLV